MQIVTIVVTVARMNMYIGHGCFFHSGYILSRASLPTPIEGVTNNLDVVHILKFASRYTDDLNIPNSTNKLENIICNDIYPQELDIVKMNSNSQCCTFLDLDIFIANKKFNTKLYDKRRDFKFNIVMSHSLTLNLIYLIIPLMELLLGNCIDYVNPVHL